MKAKNLLIEQVEREREYLAEQEVGTDEYKSSFSRLLDLEKSLHDMEMKELDADRKEQESADEKKNRKISNVLEGVKVGSGILLPIIGLVCITAVEKDTTFTGALKDYTRYFLPKKM